MTCLTAFRFRVLSERVRKGSGVLFFIFAPLVTIGLLWQHNEHPKGPPKAKETIFFPTTHGVIWQKVILFSILFLAPTSNANLKWNILV